MDDEIKEKLSEAMDAAVAAVCKVYPDDHVTVLLVRQPDEQNVHWAGMGTTLMPSAELLHSALLSPIVAG